MEEELTRAFSKFELSSTELGGVDLCSEDVSEGVKDCRRSLVGRLIGTKVANYTGVKNFTNHAWGYPRNLVVTELGPNIFQFQFDVDEEREKVLMGGPWVLDNQVLVIKNWEMGCERKPQFFRYTYLWVQVWNLPVHWLCRTVGIKVGKLFKSVREVIVPPGGGKEGRHMKILVEVDVQKPLLRGTLVKLEGVNTWVDFKYERCPDFCYNCGIVGHGDKSCNEGGKEGQSGRESQYGAWMRAGNIMTSPLRAFRGVETEVKQRGMVVATSNEDPGIHVDSLREMGVRGITGTSINQFEKEINIREQKKEAMEKKWKEFLSDNKELDKSVEQVEGKGENPGKKTELVEKEKIEISKVVVDLGNRKSRTPDLAPVEMMMEMVSGQEMLDILVNGGINSRTNESGSKGSR